MLPQNKIHRFMLIKYIVNYLTTQLQKLKYEALKSFLNIALSLLNHFLQR